MRHDFLMVDPAKMMDVTGFLVKNVAANESIPARVAKLISFFAGGADYMREVFVSHCESGAMLARRLGFGKEVEDAVLYLWEQWDGKSPAYGLKGVDTPTASRVLHFAQVMEVAYRSGGEKIATSIARRAARQGLRPRHRRRVPGGPRAAGLLGGREYGVGQGRRARDQARIAVRGFRR